MKLITSHYLDNLAESLEDIGDFEAVELFRKVAEEICSRGYLAEDLIRILEELE